METKDNILEKFVRGMMAEVKVKVAVDSQEDSANELDKGKYYFTLIPWHICVRSL